MPSVGSCGSFRPKAVCDSTDLGVMLFPVWSPSQNIRSEIPVDLVRRLLADCPNIVAIKAEGGGPGVMGLVECYRHFADEVVISCPMESALIPMAQILPIEFSATSDHEYYGPMIPRAMKHLQAGEYDAAADIFWQLQPARRAKMGAAPQLHGLGLINRLAWKYQAWLQGYSGGPLRHPTMRIHDAQMNMLRKGLAASELLPADEPNGDFFIGRCPS